MEALLRWEHPTRGLLGPAEFRPTLVEQPGPIVEVGRWVVDQACRQGRAWHSLGHRLDMSVNVAVPQIQHPRFVATVASVLEETGFEPTSLIIEVSQTAMISSWSRIAAPLGQLCASGVRVAVDDFGTGPSSISRLRDLPVDIVKISSSLASGLQDVQGEPGGVQAFVGLGRTLGIETWAAGIKGPGQLEALRTACFTTGQGYLLARPLAADDVGLALARGVTTSISKMRRLTIADGGVPCDELPDKPGGHPPLDNAGRATPRATPGPVERTAEDQLSVKPFTRPVPNRQEGSPVR